MRSSTRAMTRFIIRILIILAVDPGAGAGAGAAYAEVEADPAYLTSAAHMRIIEEVAPSPEQKQALLDLHAAYRERVQEADLLGRPFRWELTLAANDPPVEAFDALVQDYAKWLDRMREEERLLWSDAAALMTDQQQDALHEALARRELRLAASDIWIELGAIETIDAAAAVRGDAVLEADRDLALCLDAYDQRCAEILRAGSREIRKTIRTALVHKGAYGWWHDVEGLDLDPVHDVQRRINAALLDLLRQAREMAGKESADRLTARLCAERFGDGWAHGRALEALHPDGKDWALSDVDRKSIEKRLEALGGVYSAMLSELVDARLDIMTMRHRLRLRCPVDEAERTARFKAIDALRESWADAVEACCAEVSAIVGSEVCEGATANMRAPRAQSDRLPYGIYPFSVRASAGASRSSFIPTVMTEDELLRRLEALGADEDLTSIALMLRDEYESALTDRLHMDLEGVGACLVALGVAPGRDPGEAISWMHVPRADIEQAMKGLAAAASTFELCDGVLLDDLAVVMRNTEGVKGMEGAEGAKDIEGGSAGEVLRLIRTCDRCANGLDDIYRVNGLGLTRLELRSAEDRINVLALLLEQGHGDIACALAGDEERVGAMPSVWRTLRDARLGAWRTTAVYLSVMWLERPEMGNTEVWNAWAMTNRDNQLDEIAALEKLANAKRVCIAAHRALLSTAMERLDHDDAKTLARAYEEQAFTQAFPEELRFDALHRRAEQLMEQLDEAGHGALRELRADIAARHEPLIAETITLVRTWNDHLLSGEDDALEPLEQRFRAVLIERKELKAEFEARLDAFTHR
jgi:hypothetical protein